MKIVIFIMEIVRVKKEHVDAIAGLLKKEFLKPPYNETWILERLIDRVNEVFDDHGKFCFVALEKSKVIGVVLASTIVFREGTRCFVEEFVVDSEKQDMGFGAKLLERLEEECRKNKIKTLWVTANQKSSAKGFYTKSGFVLSDYRLMEK
ncbi:MAG: GNAT family N-acetyltransferase, partial [archaeon]|nr:GNAT family N-acetyltransferase [archaeon]